MTRWLRWIRRGGLALTVFGAGLQIIILATGDTVPRPVQYAWPAGVIVWVVLLAAALKTHELNMGVIRKQRALIDEQREQLGRARSRWN